MAEPRRYSTMIVPCVHCGRDARLDGHSDTAGEGPYCDACYAALPVEPEAAPDIAALVLHLRRMGEGLRFGYDEDSAACRKAAEIISSSDIAGSEAQS